MEKKVLPINEIFLSVQGEGLHIGKLALFIRFGKCNLRCAFCDTKQAWDKYQSIPVEKLLPILKQTRRATDFLILTGGEPCLNDLNELIRIAKKLKYYVALETNGTTYWPWLKRIDWITVSPKKKNIDKKILKLCNELKIIITGKKSFDLASFYLPFHTVILQPVNNNKKIASQIIRYIKHSKYNDHLRLGIQMHKVLGIK
ncbi:MAG: 7-carboxy-7-deazaguanine synthase QueE [Spirochaetes bacterium]|nr:7-carboxy-7-deazaguanine synthase QueE [Spirochaetota bacterium]